MIRHLQCYRVKIVLRSNRVPLHTRDPVPWYIVYRCHPQWLRPNRLLQRCCRCGHVSSMDATRSYPKRTICNFAKHVASSTIQKEKKKKNYLLIEILESEKHDKITIHFYCVHVYMNFTIVSEFPLNFGCISMFVLFGNFIQKKYMYFVAFTARSTYYTAIAVVKRNSPIQYNCFHFYISSAAYTNE